MDFGRPLFNPPRGHWGADSAGSSFRGAHLLVTGSVLPASTASRGHTRCPVRGKNRSEAGSPEGPQGSPASEKAPAPVGLTCSRAPPEVTCSQRAGPPLCPRGLLTHAERLSGSPVEAHPKLCTLHYTRAF